MTEHWMVTPEPNNSWRTLGWTPDGLAHIERWKAKAAALGLTTAEIGALWNEVIEDQARWPWAFSAIREADRRLMLRCAELRERPAPQLRQAAERLLSVLGPYGPADVDLFAWTIEELRR